MQTHSIIVELLWYKMRLHWLGFFNYKYMVTIQEILKKYWSIFTLTVTGVDNHFSFLSRNLCLFLLDSFHRLFMWQNSFRNLDLSSGWIVSPPYPVLHKCISNASSCFDRSEWNSPSMILKISFAMCVTSMVTNSVKQIRIIRCSDFKDIILNVIFVSNVHFFPWHPVDKSVFDRAR